MLIFCDYYYKRSHIIQFSLFHSNVGISKFMQIIILVFKVYAIIRMAFGIQILVYSDFVCDNKYQIFIGSVWFVKDVLWSRINQNFVTVYRYCILEIIHRRILCCITYFAYIQKKKKNGKFLRTVRHFHDLMYFLP